MKGELAQRRDRVVCDHFLCMSGTKLGVVWHYLSSLHSLLMRKESVLVPYRREYTLQRSDFRGLVPWALWLGGDKPWLKCPPCSLYFL